MKNKLFWIGLLVLLGYWYWIHPAGFGRGYFEDYCWDLPRQAMAENISKLGRVAFTSDSFMAPFGMPMPFFSWSLERDWLGALVWLWNPQFPFLWIYVGLSLVFSYIVTGFFLGKMGIQKHAWLLALFFVLFHVPRHFKIWHHYEYLGQHWVYFSLFLDAWIWHRFVREGRWSLTLELWRGVGFIGMLGTSGYFWGPLALEWIFVRGGLIWLARSFRAQGRPVTVEGSLRSALTPGMICIVLGAIELRWLYAWATEMRKLGAVSQGLGWFAHLGYVFRPLWLDRIWEWADLARWRPLPRIDRPETVMSFGWLYWVPALIGLRLLVRRRGGPGFAVVAPFAIFLLVGIVYATWNSPPFYFQRFFQIVVPPMEFFRAASRWGQVLPQVLGVLIALSYPELSRWLANRKTWKARVVILVFGLLSMLEVAWLLYPVNQLPTIPAETVRMLDGIKALPGTTVLDLPFCVAGGNGVCTEEQCPHYPRSTVGACFRSWHEKKVYGLYQARLVPSQCEIYRRTPFTEWFSAWREDRCFTETEWPQFCRYLDEHPEISAVLLYPGIWKASGRTECLSQFSKRLGPPLEEAPFSITSSRMRELEGASAHAEAYPERVLRYGNRCRN